MPITSRRGRATSTPRISTIAKRSTTEAVIANRVRKNRVQRSVVPETSVPSAMTLPPGALRIDERPGTGTPHTIGPADSSGNSETPRPEARGVSV
ncbi:hypothetical protein GCM10009758_32650 [Microbacterium hatanonis]